MIEPGRRFLAECGFVGAMACDGSQAVGYFWGQALGWPLVGDQDEETAIRSRHGGPEITWGGPPLDPHVGEGRVLFELVASPVKRPLPSSITCWDWAQPASTRRRPTPTSS